MPNHASYSLIVFLRKFFLSKSHLQRGLLLKVSFSTQVFHYNRNYLPPSVSCHTIPSSVTDVPGSHGPKQSGSVIVPTEVPTHASTISFDSHLIRFRGGLEHRPLTLPPIVAAVATDLLSSYNNEFDCDLLLLLLVLNAFSRVPARTLLEVVDMSVLVFVLFITGIDDELFVFVLEVLVDVWEIMEAPVDKFEEEEFICEVE